MQRKPLLLLLLVLLLVLLAGIASPAQQSVAIKVNVSERMGAFPPVWAWVGHDEPNNTYSEEGRNLLAQLSKLSSHPVHDRTHNLLTSGDGTPKLKWGSTNAFTLGADGKPVYSWTILDKIFDTYKATRVTPFVEIGFMPEALSTHPQPYQHDWPRTFGTGWSYPPKDYQQWTELVYHFVRHMVDRYGTNEVAKWEWEVWNEPNIVYWHGTVEEFCKFYDYTVAAVKRALPAARVGGPATTGPASPKAADFLRAFLEHCVNGKNYVTGTNSAPLDFISFHAKGTTKFEDGHVELNIGQNLRDVDHGFALIESFPALSHLPVVLSESDPEGCAACDAATHPQNGYRLSSQYASYEAELMQGTLALAGRHHINVEGAVTWAFTFPGEPIFAGFRSLTTHDVDLPVLNLFRMLGQMDGDRLSAESSGALKLDDVLESSVRGNSDVNVIATRSRRRVNVLVWNYDDDSTVTRPAAVDLTLQGVPHGVSKMLMKHWIVDHDHSNSYTAWQAMGSPQNPSEAQLEQLKAAGELQLLAPPRSVLVQGDTIHLTFSEAGEEVSQLDFKW